MITEKKIIDWFDKGDEIIIGEKDGNIVLKK